MPNPEGSEFGESYLQNLVSEVSGRALLYGKEIDIDSFPYLKEIQGINWNTPNIHFEEKSIKIEIKPINHEYPIISIKYNVLRRMYNNDDDSIEYLIDIRPLITIRTAGKAYTINRKNPGSSDERIREIIEENRSDWENS